MIAKLNSEGYDMIWEFVASFLAQSSWLLFVSRNKATKKFKDKKFVATLAADKIGHELKYFMLLLWNYKILIMQENDFD